MNAKETGLIAILRPVRMEVARMVRGRPTYVWVDGFQVNNELPYMRIREARAYCKDQGWRAQVSP